MDTFTKTVHDSANMSFSQGSLTETALRDGEEREVGYGDHF